MSLENFVEFEKQPDFWLVLDGYNLMYRNLFVCNKEDPTDTEFLTWKASITTSIIASIYSFKPTKVVFTLDCRKTWRKKYYPEYKANRKVARAKSTIDFDKWYEVMDKFLPDLKKAFPNIYFLYAKYCEGDDVIAVLANKIIPEKDRICIVSTDRDFIQLHTRKNLKQYDPINKKYIESINPQKDLMLKIIKGDRGDNIGAIKPRIGDKKAVPIYENLEEELKDEEVNKLFERNKILIDLKYIPLKLKNLIIDEFKKYPIGSFNEMQFLQFLMKHGMRDLFNNIGNHKDVISRVK